MRHTDDDVGPDRRGAVLAQGAGGQRHWWSRRRPTLHDRCRGRSRRLYRPAVGSRVMSDRAPRAIPTCSPRRCTTATSRSARSSPSSAAGRCRWSTPAGVVKEHNAVRSAVGVFDVSHLGKAVVRGPARRRTSTRCLTNDLGKIAPGKAQYTLCCDERRRRRRRPDRLPARRRRGLPDPQRRQHRRGGRRLRAAGARRRRGADQHRDYASSPSRAPNSDEVLAARRAARSATTTCRSSRSSIDGVPVVVCRTGYTGERGYELVVPERSGRRRCGTR